MLTREVLDKRSLTLSTSIVNVSILQKLQWMVLETTKDYAMKTENNMNETNENPTLVNKWQHETRRENVEKTLEYEDPLVYM